MELPTLLERLKMEHLLAQLDGVCEQASKGDLDYKAFLAQALDVEWRGRYQHGVDSRLKQARFPGSRPSTSSTLRSNPRSIARSSASSLG